MTPDPPPHVLREFSAQARRSYPYECCGVWLFDLIQQQHRWHPLSNRSSSPRDSFVFDTVEWLSLLDAQKRGEWKLLGSGHSHPDSAPLPSSRDLEQMLWEGRPAYPGLCWMICSVFEKRKSVEIAVYQWDESCMIFSCTMRQSLTPPCAK